MFIIVKPDRTQLSSQNHPDDDILDGLVAHHGADITVVRLATPADFNAVRALPGLRLAAEGTTISAYSRPVISEDPFELGDEELAATFEGVRVYPEPEPPVGEPIE